MMRALATATLVLALAWPAQAQLVSDHDRQEALRHYRAGEDALQREAFEQAEREFRTAADLDPHLELAPYGLGQVYMATKQYSSAVRAFTTCRNVFQENALDALQNRTAADQRLRDRITALEDARHAYESGIAKPIDLNAALRRLDMQISQLRFQRRRQSDQPAPVPAWIWVALGGAYFRSGNMAEAEREYRAALAVEPGQGEAHNNLAVVLMLRGRLDEAASELAAAEAAGIRVNPQFKADLEKARAGK